ncbi:MAG: hypothetical protein U0271_41245, partial [Polyangiaceae bacterium]
MPLPIGHLEKVRALAICDRVLAVGGVRAGSRSSLSLYDFVGEKPLASIELPAHVLGLVADKAGVIAACSDGALRWFALPGGAAEREVAAHDGAINAVALFGQVLVTAGQDGIVRTFSRADGSALRSFTVSSR